MAFTKITGPGIHTLTNIVSHNVKSSGIITAVNGNLTGWLAVGSTASFGGNVSIGGTLTYDDVTNVESVGIITAKEGIHVGAAGTVLHAINDSSVAKVGIGTTIPTAKFEISHPTHTSLIRLKRTTGNAGDFVMQIGGSNPGVIFDAVGISSDFIFQTQGNEIMRIDSLNKEVGIGTDNPFCLLDVFRKATGTNKDIFSVRSHSGAFLVECSDVAASNPTWALRTFSGEDLVLSPGGQADVHEKVRIKASTGKMGIGIASPDSMLHVHTATAGTVTADADANELILESSGNTGMSILSPGSGESSIYFGNPGTNGHKEAWIKYYHETHAITGNRRALTFKAGGGTEKMRLTSTSILGVGITTPNQESGNGIHIGGVGSTNQARLHLTTAASGHTATDGFYIVGLGNESSGSEGDVLLQNKEDANMLFSTNNTERLRITSSGITSSRSPSDATPNFKFRSDDVNWHGYLNQTVHGTTISTILSCGGTWTVDGTTYAATKDYNGTFGTAALVVHNQYNNVSTGGELVFITKANGSTLTDGAVTERLRINSTGNCIINGSSQEDNLLVKGGSTQFAVHQDDTDGEVSLRAQDGSGNNYSKYMTFFTQPNGQATKEQIRITTTGNIGVGTNNPHNYKVDVFKNYSGIGVGNTAFRVYGTDGGVAETGVCFVEKGEGDLHNDKHAYLIRGISNYQERFVFKANGKVGIGTTTVFSTFQVGDHTFSGGHGMYTDDRVGMSNHGNLTGLMLASTYNDAAHPEYGLVFVQGPTTSSYNVWSISPDGPLKGISLNLHYAAQATNIHSPSQRKVFITGIGTISPHNDGTQDLGQPGNRWRNLYTSDLDLSNEAKGGNDVDGTWGSYTIQEGESDLFLINKRSGKKYKFNLTEVE